MSRPFTHLLWLDLELTGAHEDDFILEAGTIVTTKDLVELQTWSTPVDPAPAKWMERLEKNPYVLNMHVNNGLVGDILAGKGISLDAVDREILALMETHSRPHAICLAGSGVKHFDRRFVRQYLPKTDHFLAYYEIDVGVVRRFLRDIAGRDDLMNDDSEAERKNHRAADDIRIHLNEARYYRSLFENMPDLTDLRRA